VLSTTCVLQSSVVWWWCAVCVFVSRTDAVLWILCINTPITCMLNHCLEWDKWVLNERTYPTPDSGLTHLFTRSRAVVAHTVVHLVTPDCTRGVIDPLYHSRHGDRDRQYECDRGISRVMLNKQMTSIQRHYPYWTVWSFPIRSGQPKSTNLVVMPITPQRRPFWAYLWHRTSSR